MHFALFLCLDLQMSKIFCKFAAELLCARAGACVQRVCIRKLQNEITNAADKATNAAEATRDDARL